MGAVIPSGAGITPQPTSYGVPSGASPSRTPGVSSVVNPGMINPSRYAVNQPGMMEMISQPLYDIQPYPQGGVTQLTFFQNQVGSSISGVTKTLADTNMFGNGSLPQPQQFLIQAIQIEWFPGQTSAPYQFLGVATAAGQVEDFVGVFNGKGYAVLTIGTKPYLQEGPLITLPPRSAVGIDAAASNATTAGAGQSLQIVNAFARGPLWHINPLLIPPLQNFSVTLNWPTAVPLASTDALARIGVRLWGMLFRSVQ